MTHRAPHAHRNGGTPLRRAAALALLLGWALAPIGAAAQSLRIVSPAPGETMHSNAGTVPVVVTGARPGQPLRVILDGEASPTPQAAPAFELKGVVRGEHRLLIESLDASGATVERTPPVRFFAWQASRLTPP